MKIFHKRSETSWEILWDNFRDNSERTVAHKGYVVAGVANQPGGC